MVNPLTAVLAGLTILLYVYVYTPLKRLSVWNTLVGTIPGALPALGGYTAATGHLDVAALPLFFVLVFWQMPHFLALAWIYREDYAKGGFKMLPSIEVDGVWTGRQSVFFAVLTVVASLSLLLVSSVSLIYVFGVTVAGIYFCVKAVNFKFQLI